MGIRLVSIWVALVSIGMVVGAVALVVYCGLATFGVRRMGALAGSALVLTAWGVAAGILYWTIW